MTVATPQSALYETIHSQPAVIADVLERSSPLIEQAAQALSHGNRIFLVGTGTSSHAAIVGEHLLRAVVRDAYATTSFDFVAYPRVLRPGDNLIVISHRGSKRYGAEAIARARSSGVFVVGITGQESPMDGADVLIQTAPQERSSAHTASYTANLAALARIAVAAEAGRAGGVGELRAAVEQLPDAIRMMLDRERDLVPVAQALAKRGRMILVGAGPNAATAREGALKVKETSYLTAEGFELETVLHGGLQAVESGDIGVVLAASGPALGRTVDLVRALSIIGARPLIVADERVVEAFRQVEELAPDATIFSFPAVPEALSPVLAVIPLQLLAAFTAQIRGTNADDFRAHDSAYKRATDSYTL